MSVPFLPIAGGLTGLAGTFMSGFAAEDARDRINQIANTPGVDTGMLTGQALTDQLRYLPQATQLSGQISASNQAQLNAQEESALPGIAQARQNALGQINGLFSDDSAWLRGVQRRGAALGLSSGLMGSQAGQIQTLELSDKEKMYRTQLGTGLLGSLIGGMRLANTPGVQSFLGPNPSQLINIRSQERAQKMQLEAQAAGMPSMLSTFGNSMQGAGGMMLGAGLTGYGTGGVFGRSNWYSGGYRSPFTTGDYTQRQNMAAEANGSALM